MSKEKKTLPSTSVNVDGFLPTGYDRYSPGPPKADLQIGVVTESMESLTLFAALGKLHVGFFQTTLLEADCDKLPLDFQLVKPHALDT